VDERAAAVPRAELAALLSSLSADTHLKFDLQPSSPSHRSELAGRMAAEQFSRTPEMSLPEALQVVADLVSEVAPFEPWLIEPCRPEAVGVIHVSGAPSIEVLERLSSWDGEGLLIGTEAGVDWLYLDIDRTASTPRSEVLIGSQSG
jgi:hypothetical protein